MKQQNNKGIGKKILEDLVRKDYSFWLREKADSNFEYIGNILISEIVNEKTIQNEEDLKIAFKKEYNEIFNADFDNEIEVLEKILNKKEKEIIKLRIEGKSFEEISKEYDIPEEKVKLYLATSLKKLRNYGIKKIKEVTPQYFTFVSILKKLKLM